MINYNNLISKIAELKNVKLIQRRLKINTQKSVILYEKPKAQLLHIIQSKKSIKPKNTKANTSANTKANTKANTTDNTI